MPLGNNIQSNVTTNNRSIVKTVITYIHKINSIQTLWHLILI